jgi:hypothetical protein
MEAARAYLVHVDEAWCSKVLKRLRELGSSARHELHKHTLNVSWGAEDELAELHGRALIERIRRHLPDQRSYVAKKLRWFDELGYEDPARKVTVQLRGKDPNELYADFADLAIGRRNTFPQGWSATVSDVRFGIEAKLSEFDAHAGEMNFTAPRQGRARLNLQSSGGSRAVVVEADVFRARAVFPFLPESHDLIRFVGDDVSIVVSPRISKDQRSLGAQIHFSIPAEPVPVSRLRAIAEIGGILVHAEDDPMRLSVSAQGHEVTLNSAESIPVEPELKDFVSYLDAAVAVCSQFDVPDDVLVSPADVREQAAWAVFMKGIMLGNHEPGELRAPYSSAIPIGELFGMIHLAVLRLEDRSLVLIIAAQGAVTGCTEHPGRGAAITVAQGQLRYEKFLVVSAADEVVVEKKQGELRKVLESAGCKFILDPDAHRALVEPEEQVSQRSQLDDTPVGSQS